MTPADAFSETSPASNHPPDAYAATLPHAATNPPSPITNPPATAPPKSLSFLGPGAVVKHYEIIRELGAGGMGMVFLGRDIRLGRLVAIKFLLEHSGKAAQRFLTEAQTTAQCRHENIVVIYDVDELNQYPYMVLEYIQGRTLRSAMTDNTADRAQMAIDYLLPVARALVCAHGMGIVHRDLKPENILIADNGQVKVLDFGIAKQIVVELAQTIKTAAIPTLGNSMLTQDGAIMGTMPYMSPEQWLAQPVDNRTDIWAFGVILFELATGAHPLEPLSMQELMNVPDLDSPMPSAHEKLPGASKLADVIDRCLQKKIDDRFPTAAALVTALEEIGTDKRTSLIVEDEDPYAGLSAFQESDAARFFGRNHDIAAVLGRLRNQQLVAIAGSSGAGKSSFVRAGIIPALKDAGKRFETFVIRPGRSPLAALADVLAFFADTSAESTLTADADPAAIAETLRSQPGYLGARLRARCRRRGKEHRILLFIDQLEELFTLGISAEERTAFFACLEGVADDASSPLRVIVTIRADFLDRLTDARRFSDELTRGLYFLPPMSHAGLHDALKKPLELVQYRFEDDALVDEMMAGIEGTKCPLPILQFAATKLWEARDRGKRLLTRDAYRALGGVVGALSTHADAVIAGMSVEERRAARLVFLRLVTAEKTRAIVPLEEITALDGGTGSAAVVVQNLAAARLLTIETSGERGGKTVELAHESLIERWGKLHQWLDENEQDAQFLSELRNAALQWEKSGEAQGFLWRDRAALDAGTWLERRKELAGATDKLGLAPREQRYLEAVVRLAERTRRWRRFVVATTITLSAAIAVVMAVLGVRAREQAQRADAEAKRAQKEAIEARNATRLAAARELQNDPTTVLALLREVEGNTGPARWSELARWALHSELSTAVLVHPDAVAIAEWSPNGQSIATISLDDVIRVWPANGRGEPILLRGHEGVIKSLAWSPDGTRIVTASDDKTARIWRADGQGEPIVLRAHSDSIRAALWSPDGKRIATASLDKTARFWNADGTGESIVLRGHEAAVRTGAWSPDGKHFATVSFDKTARIWNADGAGEPIVLRGHEGIVRAVAWSPDGTRLITGSLDHTARIWNADGAGEAIVFHHDEQVLAVRFSGDGSRVVTGSADKTARVWNANGSGQGVVLKGHENGLSGALFTLDGQHVITASLDATARIWRVDGVGEPRVLRGHTHDINSISMSRDGKHLATASTDDMVRIWNIDEAKDPWVIGHHDEQAESTAWSPDGTRIVSGSTDKTARIWFVDEKHAPIILRGHDAGVLGATWSRDSAFVVTASMDATARVWRADGQGDPTVLRGHAFTVQYAEFSPDGKRVVTASDDRTARVWNADGTGEPRVFQGHEGSVFMASWSPDGTRIVTASMDKTARIWNVEGKGEPIVLRGHESVLTGATWSPDGQHVATASYDKTARIWKSDGQGEPIVLRGHEAGLNALVWRPDGKQLLTTSVDHTMRLWNVDGSGEPLVLRGSTPFSRASFSPDGLRIVVGTTNKEVSIWSDLEPLHGAADARLWSATTYCLPVAQRISILGIPEILAQTQQQSCLSKIASSP